jgi:hypothetical protein
VFVCDVDEPAAILQGAKDEDQAHLITLHRLDPAPNAGQIVTALPHAPGCSAGAPPYTTASVNSFKGMLADLAHGHLKAAGRTLAGLVAPKDLNAAMFIDLGGGGFTMELSDFQFALPAKFDVLASSLVTAQSPFGVNVAVTDLHGGAVQGARVHFSSAPGGTVKDESVLTDVNGVGATFWTVSSPSDVLTAYGRGIGGSDFNGPRAGIDPFQPIHDAFDLNQADGGPITVLTGSIQLVPTGYAAPTSLDWKYLQPTNNGPSGWEGRGERSGWPTGTMAFGTAPCQVATAWDGTKDLLVSKAFTLSSSGDLGITVRVSDHMELYLNGMQVKASNIAYSATPWAGTQDSWSGGGCNPDFSPSSFLITGVPSGIHSIAIHAHSAIGATPYLDVTITPLQVPQ